MIIEIPNYVGENVLNQVKESVKPFLPFAGPATYRNGKTVSISKTLGLEEVDGVLCNVFTDIQQNIVRKRFNPPPNRESGDSGYEYHLYSPNEICEMHSDYEFSSDEPESLLRYATVILHLNNVSSGGDMVFPAQHKRIKTEAGKVVIFPPYGMFPHYTTPSEEPREVVVTWFVYGDVFVKKK